MRGILGGVWPPDFKGAFKRVEFCGSGFRTPFLDRFVGMRPEFRVRISSRRFQAGVSGFPENCVHDAPHFRGSSRGSDQIAHKVRSLLIIRIVGFSARCPRSTLAADVGLRMGRLFKAPYTVYFVHCVHASNEVGCMLTLSHTGYQRYPVCGVYSTS